MNLLEKIDSFAKIFPDKKAYINQEDILTYRQLKIKSDLFANWLNNNYPYNKTPVILYGHKQKEMIICALGCVKSGRAYIPVDISIPIDRLNDIAFNSAAKVIITISSITNSISNFKYTDLVIDQDMLNKILINEDNSILNQYFINFSEDFYIIYTSGSTGKPKGVRITLGNLTSFILWATKEFNIEHNNTILNQAPFSFDLSVMDIFLTLYNGATLWCLDKIVVLNPEMLIKEFHKSNINVWISTPSFIEYCLNEPSFNIELLPNIQKFIFCGEILTNDCVKEIYLRFPNSKVYNTYGPTETTVAISSILIDKFILENYIPLPVGYPASHVNIDILSNSVSNFELFNKPDIGEIIIKGPSVSPGYFNNQKLTEEVFFKEKNIRGYKTGDIGYLKDNLLFFCGRQNNQIKFMGYRIELEDIESKITNNKRIANAIVLPIYKKDKCIGLHAFIILKKGYTSGNFFCINLKKYLMNSLPSYMVPQKITLLKKLPLTPNGKVDKQALQILN